MSNHVDTEAFDGEMIERLGNLLRGGADASPLHASVPSIRETAFHDFSQYQFLTPPTTSNAHTFALARDTIPLLYGPPGREPAESNAAATAPVPADFVTFVNQFSDLFVKRVASVPNTMLVALVGSDDFFTIPAETRGLAMELETGFEALIAPALFEQARRLGNPPWFMSEARREVDDFLADEVMPLLIVDHPGGRGVGAGRYRRFQSAQLFWLSPVWESGRDRITGILELHGRVLDVEAVQYAFTPYLAGSVNFGIQLVYRQRWVPLGTQEGEIVRTLPLGPRQSEKVTVKAIRRTKATRQMEVATSIETATESSLATKDSQEVVQEASEKNNWHVEASAEVSAGILASASVTAGAGGEAAESSKDTKSTLNETMEKTASKLRRDTKIVVSTEVEESAERSITSEISNPNDEVAVTYVYSRLQRQYEIHTYLSEVNTCVFVAEAVPDTEEITTEWIQRWDWILAQALLDESFRGDLDVVRGYNKTASPHDTKDTKIDDLMGTVKTGLPTLSTRESGWAGTLPDIYATPQQSYERELERTRARERNQAEFARALARLRRHFCDNILHYLRAIWSSEDPDARLLRYETISAPTRWEIGKSSSGGVALLVAGEPRVPVSQLINPAGPIGFAANYSVYYLRQDGRFPQLEAAVEHLRRPYFRYRSVTEYRPPPERPSEPKDKFDVEVLLSGAWLPPFVQDGRSSRYILEYTATGESVTPNVTRYDIDDDAAFDGDIVDRPTPLRGVRSVDGWVEIMPFDRGAPVELKVRIKPRDGSSVVQANDTFAVQIHALPILEDPELRQLAYSESPLATSVEEEFYTAEVLAEFADFFPDIQRALKAAAIAPSWSGLDLTTQQFLRDHFPEAAALLELAGSPEWRAVDEPTRAFLRHRFPEIARLFDDDSNPSWAMLAENESVRQLVRNRLPEYLLRKRYTRRLLIDTNNLLLRRAVDPSSTLEPFKAFHRYIDVLSAFHEMESKRLETRRRRARLDAKQLGDPDVERVTVVTGDTKLVAVDVPGAGEDGDGNR